MHRSPRAYNFNVPSDSVLLDLLPETDTIVGLNTGFGSAAHADQVVNNILRATNMSSMADVAASTDPKIFMQRYVLLNVDASAIRAALVVNRRWAELNGGNPFIGYVSGSTKTTDGTKDDLATMVLQLGCVTRWVCGRSAARSFRGRRRRSSWSQTFSRSSSTCASAASRSTAVAVTLRAS